MKSKLIIIILCVLILLTQFFIIYRISFEFEREDVNRDGKTNVLDLLIVQKKILEKEE